MASCLSVSVAHGATKRVAPIFYSCTFEHKAWFPSKISQLPVARVLSNHIACCPPSPRMEKAGLPYQPQVLREAWGGPFSCWKRKTRRSKEAEEEKRAPTALQVPLTGTHLPGQHSSEFPDLGSSRGGGFPRGQRHRISDTGRRVLE